MARRRVEGIDAYDFPDDLRGNPLFAWMGEDYVRFVAVELLRRFREQDPGSEMAAIKCEAFPVVEVSARADGRTVRGVRLVFDLQLLLRGSDGRHWRIRGSAMFHAQGLDQAGGESVSVEFEVVSSEEAA